MTRATWRTRTTMPCRVCSARRSRCASPMRRRRASSRESSEPDMGLMSLFRRSPPSAVVAKERLRIIVAQERSARGGPDYLPLLRRELLQVIHKYLEVDPDTVQMNLERCEGHEVLELSVALPQRPRS